MFPLPENPPDLKQRVAIDEICRRSAKFREAVLEKCKTDSAWFVSAFGWTYSPNDKNEVYDLPFILFPRQIEYLHWMDKIFYERRDGLVEKARDMGVSWLSVGNMVHKWLFEEGYQGLIGSRKEDYVDNWEIDSLFGKIEYFVRNLPGWMLPRGFRMEKHRTKLKLVNPENGNALLGESANTEFSRAGRYRQIFYDEMAFWKDILKSWRAGGQASPCRIAVSTPSGKNQFYRMVKSGEYAVFTMPWYDNPLHDDEWYEQQQRRYASDDVGFAQEIEISYENSVYGVVYPAWGNIPLGSYPFERGMPLYLGIDLGLDGVALTWLARNLKTGLLRVVDFYENRDLPIDFYIPMMLGYIPEGIVYDFNDEYIEKMTEHAVWGPSVNFADPSVRARNVATGLSPADVLAKYGIFTYSNTKANDFRSRKILTDALISQIEGINIEKCERLHEAMQNARYPERSADSNSTAQVVNPIHDWTSHPRTSVEFIAVNIPPSFKTERPKAYTRQMAYNSR